MGRGGEHPFYKVLEYFLLHFMSVETVSVLIDVGLQVADGMVKASEPSFEHHDTAVQLREILSLFL